MQAEIEYALRKHFRTRTTTWAVPAPGALFTPQVNQGFILDDVVFASPDRIGWGSGVNYRVSGFLQLAFHSPRGWPLGKVLMEIDAYSRLFWPASSYPISLVTDPDPDGLTWTVRISDPPTVTPRPATLDGYETRIMTAPFEVYVQPAS